MAAPSEIPEVLKTVLDLNKNGAPSATHLCDAVRNLCLASDPKDFRDKHIQTNDTCTALANVCRTTVESYPRDGAALHVALNLARNVAWAGGVGALAIAESNVLEVAMECVKVFQDVELTGHRVLSTLLCETLLLLVPHPECRPSFTNDVARWLIFTRASFIDEWGSGSEIWEVAQKAQAVCLAISREDAAACSACIEACLWAVVSLCHSCESCASVVDLLRNLTTEGVGQEACDVQGVRAVLKCLKRFPLEACSNALIAASVHVIHNTMVSGTVMEKVIMDVQLTHKIALFGLRVLNIGRRVGRDAMHGAARLVGRIAGFRVDWTVSKVHLVHLADLGAMEVYTANLKDELVVEDDDEVDWTLIVDCLEGLFSLGYHYLNRERVSQSTIESVFNAYIRLRRAEKPTPMCAMARHVFDQYRRTEGNEKRFDDVMKALGVDPVEWAKLGGEDEGEATA